MYINPFIAGILATIFTEITILFVVSVYAAIRKVMRHD